MSDVKQQRFYVTAAIVYPNSLPHLGTAYENVACDVLARHRRARGNEVRFTMGTDEHSQSVERAARAQGLDPMEFCTRQAALFQALWEKFDIHPTAFIRTSGEANRRTAEWFMDKLYSSGYVYKDRYKAWFCPSCEQFYTERQVVNQRCPIHDRELEWVEEENYFFRLSDFQQKLLNLFDRQPDFLVPEARRHEILNVIRGGLEDISISRAFSTWGFPLTFDPSQVGYVWLDALPAYLTGIGFPDAGYEKFWPADYHVIGKDITRFHCVMWPALLMAAELPLPKHVHAHGFITLAGQKMSKSRGVFVDPGTLVDQFGSDAVRYVLMAEIPFDRDGDFSLEAFVDRYNADLANDYGNLVSRTEKMIQKYFDGRVPTADTLNAGGEELRRLAGEVVLAFDHAMEGLNFSAAIAEVRRLVGRANKYVEESAPWKLAASGDAQLNGFCYALLEALRVSTLLLYPFIPAATQLVAADLRFSIDGDLTAATRWGALQSGSPVGVGNILFPRRERAAVLEAP